MNEVEKMYSNAEIEAKNKCKSSQCIVTNPHPDWCNKCESLSKAYPSFTAEKQLELVKWLAKQPLTIDNVDGEFEFLTGCKLSDFGNFEESLAEIINKLWQDLTEEERTQIKEILE